MMNSREARFISKVASVIGAVIALVAGFLVILWVFLIPPLSSWDCFVLLIASAMLALVGAIPGMILGAIMSRGATAAEKRAPQTPPSEVSAKL